VSSVAETVAALQAGELVLLPTDTVYGLACLPGREESVRALSALKRRSPEQPVALVAGGREALLELVPELRSAVLLHGPFTLVLPNPAGRLPWLTGSRPETIGVRLPSVAGAFAELLREVGVVAATSANLHGGADPRRLDDIPREIRDAVAAALDGGDLPGAPSTVLDLTGPEPRVLREGAVPADEALARFAAALAE
jgi:tRNA threonylcarbamoyl adenosine modification protein (Sua5/YciO/YrdC/YwlC family)